MKLSILKRAIGGIAYEGIDAIDIPGRPVFDEAIGMAEYLLGRLEVEIKRGEVTDLDSPDYYRGMEELRFHVNAALDDCGAACGDDVGDRIRALRADALREGREGVAQLFQGMAPDSPLNKQGAVGDVWLSLQVARLIRGEALPGGWGDEKPEEYTSGCIDSWAAVGRMLDGAGVQGGGSSSDRLSRYIEKSKESYKTGFVGAWTDVGKQLDDAGAPADAMSQSRRLRRYIKAMKEQVKGLMTIAYQSGGGDRSGLVEIAKHVAAGRAAERNLGGGVDEACPSRLSREAFKAGEKEEQRRVCDAIVSMGSHPRPYASDVLAAVIAEIKK